MIHPYRIFPEYKLIVDYWEGDLTIEGIISAKEKQSQDPCFDPDYHVIADVRKVFHTANRGDISYFTKYIENNPKWIRDRKSAHITSTPNHLVFNVILDMKLDDTNPLQIKPFSTVSTALQWLGLHQLGEDFIESTFKELSKVQ